jgi:hypothetical protein
MTGTDTGTFMNTRVIQPALLRALVLAVAFVLARPAFGQFADETRDVTKRGTTAGDFLSIPIGARATGMGNAISATVDDATAIYWNPAGLSRLQNGAFTAEYAQWLAGIDFNYAAVVLPTGFGTVGLGVTALRTPEMEVTTVDEQDGTGETFDASSYAFSLSYGKALTDRFSIGGTVKYVTERIWHSNASSIAVDVGTMFVTPFRGIRLGAAITNFGSKLQMTGDDLIAVVDVDPNNAGNNESNRAELRTDAFNLPLTMRIGLAGEVFQGESSRLTLAVDALSPSNSEQFVNVGTEIGLLGDLLLLRAGYSELFLQDSIHSFTLGSGLRYRFGGLDLAVDYAFEAQRYFDGVNRFTFALQF